MARLMAVLGVGDTYALVTQAQIDIIESAPNDIERRMRAEGIMDDAGQLFYSWRELMAFLSVAPVTIVSNVYLPD